MTSAKEQLAMLLPCGREAVFQGPEDYSYNRLQQFSTDDSAEVWYT